MSRKLMYGSTVAEGLIAVSFNERFHPTTIVLHGPAQDGPAVDLVLEYLRLASSERTLLDFVVQHWN